MSSPPQTARSPAPQTADELLNSILGVTSFPPRPIPVSQAPPPPQALRTPPPPPVHQQQPITVPATTSSPGPAQRLHQQPPHLDPQRLQQGPAHPAHELNGNSLLDHRGPVADSIIASLPVNFPVRPEGPEGRLAFKLDLLDLIQRDPGFVDHLYNAYRVRRSAGS